ncbi:rsmH [Acrasis kona]|uniref:RsmH n=1 Tax=Acrasis kona TaxID=1008807 RepID=A0AAW2Z4T4_9EUKA
MMLRPEAVLDLPYEDVCIGTMFLAFVLKTLRKDEEANTIYNIGVTNIKTALESEEQNYWFCIAYQYASAFCISKGLMDDAETYLGIVEAHINSISNTMPLHDEEKCSLVLLQYRMLHHMNHAIKWTMNMTTDDVVYFVKIYLRARYLQSLLKSLTESKKVPDLVLSFETYLKNVKADIKDFTDQHPLDITLMHDIIEDVYGELDTLELKRSCIESNGRKTAYLMLMNVLQIQLGLDVQKEREIADNITSACIMCMDSYCSLVMVFCMLRAAQIHLSHFSSLNSDIKHPEFTKLLSVLNDDRRVLESMSFFHVHVKDKFSDVVNNIDLVTTKYEQSGMSVQDDFEVKQEEGSQDEDDKNMKNNLLFEISGGESIMLQLDVDDILRSIHKYE